MCRAGQPGIVLFRPKESQPNVPATADRQRAGDGAIEPHTQVEAGSFSEVARNVVVRRKVNARDGVSRNDLHLDRASVARSDCLYHRAEDDFQSSTLPLLLEPHELLALLRCGALGYREASILGGRELPGDLDHRCHAHPQA
jgi:hypothetical protein